MEYDLLRPWLTLDDWQKEYIATETDCFLLCSRQAGKTTAMSIKFGERAAKRENRTILMIALTEKQAYNLFFKTLCYLEAVYPKMIMQGKNKPTKHEIHLKNGSKIMCHAAGLKGEGIRTYTVTDLAIDEAAPMAREVFISVSPMLSVTGGTMDIASTPKGKEGYFYEASLNPKFKKFYVAAEDCPRHKTEFLAEEKKRMTEMEYAQEYKAMFLDELKQLFKDDMLHEAMSLPGFSEEGHFKPSSPLLPQGETRYLGIDISRLGEDKTVLLSVSRTGNRASQIDMEIMQRIRIPEIVNKILEKNKKHNPELILIDTGGIGGAVLDYCLLEESIRRKVVSVDNASRSLNRDKTQRKRILKEDLYMNLLKLFEQRYIKLFKDEELFASLKSVQYEYDNGELRIFSNNNHCAEALIRAVWPLHEGARLFTIR